MMEIYSRFHTSGHTLCYTEQERSSVDGRNTAYGRQKSGVDAGCPVWTLDVLCGRWNSTVDGISSLVTVGVQCGQQMSIICECYHERNKGVKLRQYSIGTIA